jgi:hypothetical protein
VSRTGWKNATPGAPCPICAHGDWCSIATDGRAVLCRRVAGDEPAREDQNGAEYWLHWLSGTTGAVVELPKSTATPRAAVAVLDRVYRCLLDACPLLPEHRRHLRDRGLTDVWIDRAGYASLQGPGRARIARALVERFGAETCVGVPGCYVREEDGRRWWSIAGSAGILIPVRDVCGRIVALKVRRDAAGDGPRYLWVSSAKHGGPGPGQPVHVPLHEGRGSLVRLTEGELKADVAFALSGLLTLGLPSVTCWRQALPVLRTLDVQTVRLAFDMDAATNPHVARALRQAVRTFSREGY